MSANPFERLRELARNDTDTIAALDAIEHAPDRIDRPEKMVGQLQEALEYTLSRTTAESATIHKMMGGPATEQRKAAGDVYPEILEPEKPAMISNTSTNAFILP